MSIYRAVEKSLRSGGRLHDCRHLIKNWRIKDNTGFVQIPNSIPDDDFAYLVGKWNLLTGGMTTQWCMTGSYPYPWEDAENHPHSVWVPREYVNGSFTRVFSYELDLNQQFAFPNEELFDALDAAGAETFRLQEIEMWEWVKLLLENERDTTLFMIGSLGGKCWRDN